MGHDVDDFEFVNLRVRLAPWLWDVEPRLVRLECQMLLSRLAMTRVNSMPRSTFDYVSESFSQSRR